MRRVFRYNPKSGRMEEQPPRQGGARGPQPPPAPECLTWRVPLSNTPTNYSKMEPA